MYKKLGIVLSTAVILSACVTDETDSGSSSNLALKINGESYSSSAPYEVTSDNFKVSWESTGRTDLYISPTPTITDESEAIYGYNWGSNDLTCSIDASYVEMDCDLTNTLIDGSASISQMVTQLPTTLYLVVKQTEFNYEGYTLNETVEVTSLPLSFK